MSALAAPITLQCPKCAGDLVTYERQGVHVDQCRDCRGVWLDRGELDHLIDAEAVALARRVGAVPLGANVAAGGAIGPGSAAPYDDGRASGARADRSAVRDEDRRGGFLGDLLGDILGG
jgi:uncharacterized protein